MANFLDLTGKKFGKLTVVGFSRDVKSGKRNRKYWNCICECGGTKEVRTDCLTSGNTTSCGCKHKEISYKNLTTDYAFKPKYKIQNKRLYGIWQGMIKRCTDVNNRRYERYMKRGISVCDEWFNYDNFALWSLFNGYKDNLTIDRINNNGNYEPSNCRWISIKEQCRNRSTNIKVSYKGQEVTLIELSEIVGIEYSCLNARYRRGDRNEKLIRPISILENNNSKISVKEVKEIREKYSNGATIKELTKIYPLTYGSILNIVHFKTWKNI